MSAREAEVLDAVAAHLSNAQIAGRLHISVRTVESHVRSLLRKFGAADRRELAALAPAATSHIAAVELPAPWTSFVGRSGNGQPCWPRWVRPGWSALPARGCELGPGTRGWKTVGCAAAATPRGRDRSER
jgi:DNA-binding CsgD family transcriptional regulator